MRWLERLEEGLIAFLMAAMTLTAFGPASVQVMATNSAKIIAEGTATVTVAGHPACTVNALGSASVSGCR